MSFKVRLQDAESRFLDSLSTRQDIEIFRDFWSLLVRDIENASNVDDETVTTYHEISRLVDELSHSMIGFYSDIETIDVAFHQDLLTHLQEYKLPSTSFVPSTRRDISHAAKWLSQNYHNPYPTRSILDEISKQANWNRKDVDAWFTDARKRIGWTEIRKKFFQNKRANAISKATEFFDGRTSLEPLLFQAFMDMQQRVQDLYVEPFTMNKITAALGGADISTTCLGFFLIPFLSGLADINLRINHLEDRAIVSSDASRREQFLPVPCSVSSQALTCKRHADEDTVSHGQFKRARFVI